MLWPGYVTYGKLRHSRRKLLSIMEGEIQVGGLLNSAPNIYKFGRFVAKPSPWTEGDPTSRLTIYPMLT